MTISEYQNKAHTFADYKHGNGSIDNAYPILGLAEEAGEVCGKFGKAIRDNHAVIEGERRNEIIKELGDVMWFVAELCTSLDVSLEEVMQKNIDKLTSRKERGVIHGEGDNR